MNRKHKNDMRKSKRSCCTLKTMTAGCKKLPKKSCFDIALQNIKRRYLKHVMIAAKGGLPRPPSICLLRVGALQPQAVRHRPSIPLKGKPFAVHRPQHRRVVRLPAPLVLFLAAASSRAFRFSFTDDVAHSIIAVVAIAAGTGTDEPGGGARARAWVHHRKESAGWSSGRAAVVLGSS